MSTTIQHTPGPWTIDKTGFLILHDFYRSPDNYGSIKVTNLASHGDYMDRAQQMANARLIAAAPELLAALKMCVDALSALPAHYHDAHTSDDLAQARAAIAKAQGGVAK